MQVQNCLAVNVLGFGVGREEGEQQNTGCYTKDLQCYVLESNQSEYFWSQKVMTEIIICFL